MQCLVEGRCLLEGVACLKKLPKVAALIRERRLFEARGLSEEIREYMYYLSACNRGLFKSCYCYVLFLPFKKFSKYQVSKKVSK